MDYSKRLKYHYSPAKGWINDPNGLVYFNGYYHVFYQHSPNYEIHSQEPFCWGHARTKDFLNWEELDVALKPSTPYDDCGCFSGTAIVKDGILYLFYASIFIKEGETDVTQTISVAYSKDGITFEKYEKNPIISEYPKDGSPDFRDPAIISARGKYYCVIASGHVETKTGRLLLYESEDLFNWSYVGVMSEWQNCQYTECPSFVKEKDKFILSTSVCPHEENKFFSVMYGSFEDNKFSAEVVAEADKGPDQYAGQIFTDDKGRNILISWIPGWEYNGYAEKSLGCMSVPRQIIVKDGKIRLWPVEEVRHLLKESDSAVCRTEDGFIIERTNRTPVVYSGEIRYLKIIRDEYILEVFVNGGEEVYSVLL